MKKIVFISIIIISFSHLYSNEITHYKSSISNIFNYKNQKKMILISAISLPISFLLDKQINDFAVEYGFYSDDISKMGDIYGHRYGYFAVVGGMIITDFAMQKDFEKSLSEIRLVGEGVLAGQVVIELLKTISHRKRPNGNGFRSFPSGHAGGAFGMATILQNIYGKKVGIPAYLMAFFVASSRIHDNKHYLSDVVAGGLIGTMVAKGFSKHYEKKWKFQPNISMTQMSININIYF